MPVNVISAPIVLSLEEPRTQTLLQSFLLSNNSDEETKYSSYRKLQEHILKTGLLDKVRILTKNYTDKALASLSAFPESDAKSVLQNIAVSLSN